MPCTLRNYQRIRKCKIKVLARTKQSLPLTITSPGLVLSITYTILQITLINSLSVEYDFKSNKENRSDEFRMVCLKNLELQLLAKAKHDQQKLLSTWNFEP